MALTNRLLCLGLPLALSLAAVAHAHSNKEGSLPADGATLTAAPETIALRFDKPILITFLRLSDPAGAAHDLKPETMTPVTEYAVAPGKMTAGRYTVEWRGLSADGHPVEGDFSFIIE